VWHGIKGDDVPFPASKCSAFLKLKEKKGKDDD
jgi:hypothetical protein